MQTNGTMCCLKVTSSSAMRFSWARKLLKSLGNSVKTWTYSFRRVMLPSFLVLRGKIMQRCVIWHSNRSKQVMMLRNSTRSTRVSWRSNTTTCQRRSKLATLCTTSACLTIINQRKTNKFGMIRGTSSINCSIEGSFCQI